MLSLRPVGSLAAESHDLQPPLPLPHPTDASVVLVGGERASEHDSFHGSCNAKIFTPPPGGEVVGGGGSGTGSAAASSTDGSRLRATLVVGEGGRALLAQFYQKHGCMAISEVSRGLHRCFIRLRIGQPRGSNKIAGGGVQCMAGSQTDGAGLVFLGRVGVSALQAVRVDPPDSLGSLSQPLGEGGAVLALACHPSRPIVAACLSDRTICLWDYQGVCGQDTSRFSTGSGGGGGGGGWGVGGGGDVAGLEAFGVGVGGGVGGGGGGGSGMGSPTFSPPKGVRGSSKAGKDEKIPLKPRLEGRLSRIATLSTEGVPWGSPLPELLAEGFLSVAFHPAREWLCACTGRGLVGVWNLDGVVGGRSRGGGETEASSAGHQAASGIVRPFAARVIDAVDGDPTASGAGSNSSGLPGAGNSSPSAGGSSPVSAPFSVNAAVTSVFLASEPVVMVVLSWGLTANLPGLMLASSSPSRSRLVLLSLLDATLPVLHSIVAPHPIEHLCVEPRSGRVFAARSRPPAVSGGGGGGIHGAGAGPAAAAASVTAAAAAAAAAATAAQSTVAAVGAAGAGVGVGVGGSAAGGPAGGGGAGAISTRGTDGGVSAASNGPFDGWTEGAGAGGKAGEGAVSVLALASGSFLDRGPLRVLNTTMDVPPTVFLDGVHGGAVGRGGTLPNSGHPQQPLVPLPLQVFFLRSMSVLIQAGPGGGVDVPAVKAVLHAQGLERDKGLKDRSKPRRLASLPGHTDDLLRHGTGEESSGFPSGHLMPYRLVAGPLLRLSGAENAGGAAGSVSPQEERRRFLVLYEVVASEGSDRPPPLSRDEALRETSRTVCGLVTPAGYGEAHGRYENEAQLSRLFPATDGCFVSTSESSPEPSALLVEGGGYVAAVYSVPNMKPLGKKTLPLPVTRVLATPDCLGSQRGKVLYVVRSPYSPSGFLETMVYSDQGGLQCPEPLLPVLVQGSGGSVSPGWGGDRPYANTHLVLEPSERVVDAKFQPLSTVTELAAWGYRRVAVNTSGSNTVVNGAPPTAVPMLAVLTTRRVLVLSAPSLTPVAQAWGHPPNSRSALGASGGLSVSPVSLAWAGSSVICTLEDGRIVYLNPGDGMYPRPRDHEPGAPSSYSSLVPSGSWRPLCSTDRLRCAGGIGIAACLPDRLCLVVRGGAGGGIAHLVTRPLFPLELLISGVLGAAPAVSAAPAATPSLAVPSSSLSLASSASSGSIGGGGVERLLDEGTLNVLRRVVARYSPPRSRLPRGTNPGDGPGLGAGATCTAFRLLSRYGLHVLAAEVAGISTGNGSSNGSSGGGGVNVENRSSDVFMRRRPWISPLERSRCAAALSLPFTAMIEGIGDDPALVDTFVDPDAMTSALLPAVGSRLARMALSLGEESARLGLHEDAARLMDLSGDDSRLKSFLSDCFLDASKSNDSSTGAESFKDLIRTEPDDSDQDAGGSAVAERLRALRSAREAGSGDGTGFEAGATGERETYETGLFRRTSLLAGVSRIPQSSSGGLKGKALEAAGGGATWDAMVEEAKPVGGLNFGDRRGIGEGPPSSSLRPLALHCAEQWAGRVRPECLEPSLHTPSIASTAAKPTASGDGAGLNAFATAGTPNGLDGFGGLMLGPPSVRTQQQQQPGEDGWASTLSSPTHARSAAAASAAGPQGEGGTVSVEGKGKEMLQQPWVSVGGSWREEENVCGYWRFSEGSNIVDVLEEGKQVEIRDLSKYGSVAVARGEGLRFEYTSSPVDPGERGKVAEAVDVCFPAEVAPLSDSRSGNATAGSAGDVIVAGGYQRGVFVKAARGSSIDVGLFHDDQKRSVATVEVWVNAGEQQKLADNDAESAGAPTAASTTTDDDRDEEEEVSPSLPSTGAGVAEGGAVPRRFQQEFHVLACRVSASGEHVWSLVVENNGQLAFIPGPGGRRDLGPGFSFKAEGKDEETSKAKIGALKEAVYTEAGTFSWDKWTHVAVTMDTSRDESSAEVRLFLDGLSVGFGTCRFNKVGQFSLSETWMVLGPDLLGWKLTEARVWAMLRDEEALQDWKDNSLSLAETKKARLIFRAAAKVKDSAPRKGGAAGGLLAPPPGSSAENPARPTSKRLTGSLPPPPGGIKTDTGRRGLLNPPGSASKDPRKARASSGLGSGPLVPNTRVPRPLTPTQDPRKAALAAKRTPSKASVEVARVRPLSLGSAARSASTSPLNFAAFETASGGALGSLRAVEGDQQPAKKDRAGVTESMSVIRATSSGDHLSEAVVFAAPASPLKFATFSTGPGDETASLPSAQGQRVRPSDEAMKPSAAVAGEEPTTSLGDAAEMKRTVALPSATSPVEYPSNENPTKGSPEDESSQAQIPGGDISSTTSISKRDSSAIGTNAWADLREREGETKEGELGVDGRYSGLNVGGAALATPTNSDVSTATPPSASWAAFEEDTTSISAQARILLEASTTGSDTDAGASTSGTGAAETEAAVGQVVGQHAASRLGNPTFEIDANAAETAADDDLAPCAGPDEDHACIDGQHDNGSSMATVHPVSGAVDCDSKGPTEDDRSSDTAIAGKGETVADVEEGVALNESNDVAESLIVP